METNLSPKLCSEESLAADGEGRWAGYPPLQGYPKALAIAPEATASDVISVYFRPFGPLYLQYRGL